MMKPSTYIIYPLQAFKDNYIWTVVNPTNSVALVIDPGDAQPVLTFLSANKLDLSAILLTHHHWDHCNGVEELRKNFSVPVYGFHTSNIVTHSVKEKDEIICDYFPKLQVLEIPGHTLDHLAYYTPNIIFSGDTLFSAGCGRVFEGTYIEMYTSLMKIFALPNDIQIYCGHEYTLQNLLFAQTVEPENPAIVKRLNQVRQQREQNLPTVPTTLAEEKATNPFLRCRELQIVKAAERKAGIELKNPVEVFACLRSWKDQFVG